LNELSKLSQKMIKELNERQIEINEMNEKILKIQTDHKDNLNQKEVDNLLNQSKMEREFKTIVKQKTEEICQLSDQLEQIKKKKKINPLLFQLRNLMMNH